LSAARPDLWPGSFGPSMFRIIHMLRTAPNSLESVADQIGGAYLAVKAFWQR
jgi:hypothetical protein